MTLPYIIREHNHCSYPLHPSKNYHGEGYHRWLKKIPATHHVVILPSWHHFAPGEWWWCPRCTRRNAARLVMVKRLAEKALTARELARIRTPQGYGDLRRALKIWGGSKEKGQIGGRFVTFLGQTRYARRHAPPGMEWCSYGFHYAPLAEMAAPMRYRKVGYCHHCYRRHIRGRDMRYVFTWQETQVKDRAALAALHHNLWLARRELADLRRLKEALAQEIVTQQHRHEKNDTAYATMVGEESTSETAPLPGEKPSRQGSKDRRKAYSV